MGSKYTAALWGVRLKLNNLLRTRRRTVMLACLTLGLVLVVAVTSRMGAAPNNTYIVNYGYTGEESCAWYGWKPRKKPRKVVDAFLFNMELELLELRLKTLYEVVDVFVIIECTRTFTNKPKPLYFHENRDRFKEFMDKIVHIKLDETNISFESNPWLIEGASRRVGLAAGMRAADPQKGDLIVYGDVDEIPRPDVLRALTYCDGVPKTMCLASRMYYLSFEFRHDGDWHYPNTVLWDDDVKDVDEYRSDKGTCMADAGWHCSYCFKDPKLLAAKLTSNSHHEKNTASAREVLKKLEKVRTAYCNGEDPLQGAWNRFLVQRTTVGLPDVVLEDREKYDYLMPGKCRQTPPDQAME